MLGRLKANGVIHDYAIGGAVAVSLWAEPVATQDLRSRIANDPADPAPIKPNATRTFAGILVRTFESPEPLVPVITKALEAFAPNQPEPYVFSGDQAMHTITRERRFMHHVALGLLIGLPIA